MQRRTFIAAALALFAAASGNALADGYRAEYRLSTVLGTAFPWGQARGLLADVPRRRGRRRPEGRRQARRLDPTGTFRPGGAV